MRVAVVFALPSLVNGTEDSGAVIMVRFKERGVLGYMVVQNPPSHSRKSLLDSNAMVRM